MSFSMFDAVFAALTVLLAVRCYFRGFVAELFTMAAAIFGFIAAIFFHKSGGIYLKENYLPDSNIIILNIIAFAALFLIIFILTKILQFILTDIIHKIKLSGVDRALGLLLGLVEGIVVTCLALFLLNIQPFADVSEMLSGSFFARIFLPLIAGEGSVTGV